MRGISARVGRGGALALVLGFAVVGCSAGGSNGVAQMSAADAVSAARAAAVSAASVHIKGTLVNDGDPVTLDMRLRGADGGSGQVTAGGDTFELLRIGQQVYLRGDARFYSSVAGERAGLAPMVTQALQGKYLRIPDGATGYRKFTAFTSIDGLFANLIRLPGKLRKDGQVTVRGARSLSVVAGDSRGGPALAVAMDGTPYPMRYQPAGASGGTVEFFDYGQPVDLAPPPAAQILDIDALAKTATGAASASPSALPSRRS